MNPGIAGQLQQIFKQGMRLLMKRRYHITCPALLVFSVAMLYACQPNSSTMPAHVFEASDQSHIGVSDHMIVDCLLPGQIRRIGTVVYQSPRRPMRLPARECNIRGGEYVVYDQTNYRTALKIWLSRAKTGDREAQTNVGEIYEKGLGIAPDYGLAAQWYRKAADQGYTRAQINLGHLYELGLGVPKDMAAAIRWYRMGAGLSERLAIQGFAPEGATRQVVEELRQEIERLQQELDKARRQLQDSSDRRDEALRLRRRISDLETGLAQAQQKKGRAARAKIPKLPSMDEGTYFALIIGNSAYKDFSRLNSPHRDTDQLAKLLRRKYGFAKRNIHLIKDATHEKIFEELAWFQKKLRPLDKLLIYFAGHGTYDKRYPNIGYWLPVDARKGVQSRWISNEQITLQINKIYARHIMVIADSCYSGAMTDFAVLQARPGLSKDALRQIAENIATKQSRTVLTSGSNTPVFDSGGGEHSVFAEALLKVLEENSDILPGKDLFNEVFPRVSSKSRKLYGTRQEPNYGALRTDEPIAGDFLFIPQTMTARSPVPANPEPEQI
jgi:TPR repeat protein/uncharacterized caspase-like protein